MRETVQKAMRNKYQKLTNAIKTRRNEKVNEEREIEREIESERETIR
jgi:hypothetical protein